MAAHHTTPCGAADAAGVGPAVLWSDLGDNQFLMGTIGQKVALTEPLVVELVPCMGHHHQPQLLARLQPHLRLGLGENLWSLRLTRLRKD